MPFNAPPTDATGSVPPPQAGDALVCVHVQQDFLPGGALPVPHGDEVVPALNAWLDRFRALGLPILATRDWHPPDHCSFTAQGGPWPPHCVAGSAGAQFAEGLRLPPATRVFSGAYWRAPDSYSGFERSDLEAQLRALGVRRLFVGGLATDYCVRATVTAALARGFDVVVLEGAVRGIDAQPGDSARALGEMRGAGAVLLHEEAHAA